MAGGAARRRPACYRNDDQPVIIDPVIASAERMGPSFDFLQRLAVTAA